MTPGMVWPTSTAQQVSSESCNSASQASRSVYDNIIRLHLLANSLLLQHCNLQATGNKTLLVHMLLKMPDHR